MENLLKQQLIRSLMNEIDTRVLPKIEDPSALAALNMCQQLIEFLAQDELSIVSTDTPPTDANLSQRLAVVMREARGLEEALQPQKTLDQAPSSQTAITPEILEPYVRKMLKNSPNARVIDLHASLGGFSKETYIVRLADADIDAIVIRRDVDGGPVELTAAEEFPALCAAFRQGVPVAEPLWADSSPPFGQSVVVTRLVPGSSPFDLTGTTMGAEAPAAAKGLARALAKVHLTPMTDVGTDANVVEAPAQVHVQRLLDQFEDQWQRRRVWNSSIIATAFTWLRENIPRDAAPATVVHGDASLRNLLVENGRTTALLDWELWHFGDPGEDLAYARQDVEQVIPWDEFMVEYAAHGGPAQWDLDTGDYYGLWASLRNAVLCGCCLHGFIHAENPEPRMAYAGIIHYRRFLLDIARRLKVLAEKER